MASSCCETSSAASCDTCEKKCSLLTLNFNFGLPGKGLLGGCGSKRCGGGILGGGGGLLGGGDCGCGASSCGTKSCGCTESCGTNSCGGTESCGGGLLTRPLFGRRAKSNDCGCAMPSLPAPLPAANACGCDAPADTGCGCKKREGLLGRLLKGQPDSCGCDQPASHPQSEAG